jgi:hypothetical protein
MATICLKNHEMLLYISRGDGKQRLTDVATSETLLRLIQSVHSPKAEPIKFLVDLEEKTGRSVVTGENFLPPGRKNISDK